SAADTTAGAGEADQRTDAAFAATRSGRPPADAPLSRGSCPFDGRRTGRARADHSTGGTPSAPEPAARRSARNLSATRPLNGQDHNQARPDHSSVNTRSARELTARRPTQPLARGKLTSARTPRSPRPGAGAHRPMHRSLAGVAHSTADALAVHEPTIRRAAHRLHPNHPLDGQHGTSARHDHSTVKTTTTPDPTTRGSTHHPPAS